MIKKLKLPKSILIPKDSILIKEEKDKHYFLNIDLGNDVKAVLAINEESLLKLQALKPTVSIF